jgi:hypothetical protein
MTRAVLDDPVALMNTLRVATFPILGAGAQA